MVLETLLIVLVVELLLYLMFTYWKGFSAKLKDKGLHISAFTVMLDIKKAMEPKSWRSSAVSKAIGFIGVINVAVLIVLFYWMVIPSIFEFVKALMGTQRVVSAPFVPVVPGITIKGSNIICFMIGVGVAVITHELLHAITALREGIKVESWGLGVFLIFPFAYVRIDDEGFNKSSLSSKVKVLSAGVLSNTAFALMLLIALNAGASALEQYSVVVIYELDRSLGPEAPALIAGIPTPSVINSINGTEIKSLADLRNYLLSISDKSTSLILNISRFNALVDDVFVRGLQEPELIVVNKPSNMSRLGILVIEALSPSTPAYLYYLNRIFYWTYVVNISLAIFNAAPLVITDGGRILQEVFRKYGMVKVGNILQWGTVAVTAVLLVAGFIRFI